MSTDEDKIIMEKLALATELNKLYQNLLMIQENGESDYQSEKQMSQWRIEQILEELRK